MAQLQITVIALLAVALTTMQGVEAGRYRRVVWGNATVVNGREATDVFGLNATCYNQTMYDFCTLEVIGWMNECLTNILSSSNCDNGLNLTVTTFFMIGDSMIVTRGFASVQPVAVTGEATAPRVTHLTGSFTPDPPLEGHGIISATNEFMGAQGTVRLSGGANLFPNGSLGFNCIYVLDAQIDNPDIEGSGYVFQRSVSAYTKPTFLVLLVSLLGAMVVVATNVLY